MQHSAVRAGDPLRDGTRATAVGAVLKSRGTGERGEITGHTSAVARDHGRCDDQGTGGQHQQGCNEADDEDRRRPTVANPAATAPPSDLRHPEPPTAVDSTGVTAEAVRVHDGNTPPQPPVRAATVTRTPPETPAMAICAA